MAGMTRRAWLTTWSLAPLAPLAGVTAGWATVDKRRGLQAQKGRLSPRERLQRSHLPNVELITQDGRKVRFYDDLVKGKKVVISFMYATCEGICTPVTMNMVRLQKRLGDRVGRDIFFYSITLKPEEDTPPVLKKYAAMHGANWLFLTGTLDSIEVLRRGLGFYYEDPIEDADKSNHAGLLRFGIEPIMWWAGAPGLAHPDHVIRRMLFDFDSPSLRGRGWESRIGA